MATEEVLPLLAWGGLAAWLVASVLMLRGRLRAAGVLHALLAFLFVVPGVLVLGAWALDPEGYARRKGTAALGELRFDGVLLALGLIALAAAALEWRGRRWAGIVAALLTAAFLAFLFYLEYFFRIF
jgi:hypothetical protein